MLLYVTVPVRFFKIKHTVIQYAMATLPTILGISKVFEKYRKVNAYIGKTKIADPSANYNRIIVQNF